MLVKSTLSYDSFIGGRDVENAVHREDDSAGECCAQVSDADVRGSDIAITEAEFSTLVQSIKAYNASLSPVVPVAVLTLKETYATLETDAERIAFLARMGGLT